jgi:hypothetical protein
MVSSATATSTSAISSFSNILAPTTTSAPLIVLVTSPLTTYTSYTTSTFVSDGTTYKQSQGVLVIVTNSAEFSSLSAAGALQTTASSGTARTVSQTVKGMYQWQEMAFRTKGTNPTSSDQLQFCNSFSFHSCISRCVNWCRCWRWYWHRWHHPDTRPYWLNYLVPAATAANAPRKTASGRRSGSEATTRRHIHSMEGKYSYIQTRTLSSTRGT